MRRIALLGLVFIIFPLCCSERSPEFGADAGRPVDEIGQGRGYGTVSSASAEVAFQEYDGSPELVGRIYYNLAGRFCSQEGYAHPEKAVQYCAKALEYPQSLKTRLLLYTWWGGSLWPRNMDSARNIPGAGTPACEVYLRGIKEARDAGLQEEAAPELTFEDFPELYVSWTDENGVERKMPYVIDRGSRTKEEQLQDAKEEQHREALYKQIADRKDEVEAVRQRKCIEDQIVYMYSFLPDRTEELRVLADKIVGDATLTQHLLEGVERTIAIRDIETQAQALIQETLDN